MPALKLIETEMQLPVPPDGTLTSVSNGHAVLVSTQLLRDIMDGKVVRAQVVPVLDTLEEREFEYAMAILDEDDTGIANTLWFIPVPGAQHGPRIKVAIDPANAVRQDGVTASVPFDANKAAEGPIPPSLEKQVREFIKLNRAVLMKYWNLEFSSSKKFTAELQPLPKRR